MKDNFHNTRWWNNNFKDWIDSYTGEYLRPMLNNKFKKTA